MEKDIEAPECVDKDPIRDLRLVFPEVGAQELFTDIRHEWPSGTSALDASQLQALKRVMTKRLAIIQVSKPTAIDVGG